MPELILNGLKIVSSIYVADVGHVRRSWTERLFSLPWRPFQSTKTVYEPRVFLVDNVAMVSPQTFCMIERDGRLEKGVIIGPLVDTLAARRKLKGE